MIDIAGLLFDKDGTLFDFNATWGAWAHDFLAKISRGDTVLMAQLAGAIGYNIDAKRFRRDSIVIAGTPADIAEALLPFLPGATAPSLITQMNISAARAPQVEAAPLNELLTEFRNRGLKLGVATNDAEVPAKAHLRSAGILALFDFVSGYDSGFGGKPLPGPCFGFAEAVRIAPGRLAMVGDSRHDLLAGKSAGMVTIGVLTGHARTEDLAPLADVVLPSIAEIPDWLDTQAFTDTAA